MRNPEYMGDAVYARFDGLGIEISVGDHRNSPVVIFEPEVMDALMRFYAAAKSGALLRPTE